MAAKKKSAKKPAKSKTKKSIRKTTTAKPSTKKKTAKKKPVKKAAPKRPTTRKKSKKKAPAVAPKKPAEHAKSAAPKKATASQPQQNPRALPTEGGRASSAGQSGDLQGLSRRERADSESVDELIEEGNAFEADAVQGVEDAGDHEEEEVHTHEVPEDDVPGEYIDEE